MDEKDTRRREQLRTLGFNISRIREEQGVSQIDMAYRLGYTNHAHLSRIEGGRKAPSVATLLRMADILGVPAKEFFEDV